MPQLNPLERRLTKFMEDPGSVRNAAGTIVTATAVVVVAGGILMRVLDHHEYSNVWVGMWWALQTVTTVGYGDVTPKAISGRIVAAFVMLEGIAFLAIVTASITSTFVARAAEKRVAEREEAAETEEQRIEERFDAMQQQLADIVELLGKRENP
ncbi:MAG TPA: potassium channel family protein [Gaiellaceae bacterium]|nr:potassium channel family protein [Gaiellaceae bacterium]